ncbi:MAG: hypothetical protein ACI9OO_001740 [Bacteroidia bacterium]|jgi:hypothetical protein
MSFSTADKLDIHELIARYTHALDYHNIPLMRDIWTDDCRFQADEPEVNISGIEDLSEFFRQTVAAVPNVRHVISNLYVDGRGSEAICNAYIQIIDFDTKTLIAAGRYRDELVRSASGWRIRNRIFTAG